MHGRRLERWRHGDLVTALSSLNLRAASALLGRARLIVLSSYIPVIAVESAWNTGYGGTFQSKAQAIESGRGLRRSYQPVVGLEGVPSEASDKVAKQPLRSTT